MIRLSYKQPTDRFIEIISFRAVLLTGEIVSYANAIPRVDQGDANDASSIIGTVLASADTAQVEIKQGSHNNIYSIRVLISSSLGNTWEEDLILPIWDFNK